MFETIVTDTLDSTQEYNLLQQAEGMIENARPWSILTKLDQSQSRGAGDTYLTTKSLPSDFRKPQKLQVGTDQFEYKRIMFEERINFRNVPYYYYIDFVNALFALTGAGGATGTINMWYTYKPAALATSAITPVWPSEFHPILAYKMAEIFQGGIDSDSISQNMSVANNRFYQEMWRAMVAWDADLKENDIEFFGRRDSAPPLDLGRL